jgi:DNA repair exonuclease SbcCD nuclease subunit
MRSHFIHAADIHLGYEQYNLTKRADDFARAFHGLVEHTIAAQADFLLLAGDLFHRANADAWMLTQAMAGLEDLQRAGIPVVAVEGNHDMQHTKKNLSWMQFLCDQELLILLSLRQEANGRKLLVPWDRDSRRGTYIDLAGVRIYGLKYYGALTSRILEEVRDQLEPGPGGYTILMLHAGIQGQVPHLHGGLTQGDLVQLQPPVDYLALGHVHKQLMDEWVFNPGSTETNSIEEMDWPHGFFEVTVDTSRPTPHEVKVVKTATLRPFHRISVSADGTGSLDEFVARAEKAIEDTSGIEPGAVIELHLGGVADFRRQDVPLAELSGAVEVRFSPLVVRVRNNLVPPGVVGVRHGERLRRDDLERQIVEQLVYQQGEYRDRAVAWTKLVLDVKNMAADKDLPASIVDHVRNEMRRLREESEAVTRGEDRAAETEPAQEQEPVEAAVPAGEAAESAMERPFLTLEVEEPLGGEPPCMANLFEDW